jgi:hypothetical protein
MPATRRRFGPAILALLLCCLLLTGCMQVDRSLHINANGSGVYTLTIGYREPTAGDSSSVSQSIVAPMDSFGAYVTQTGGSYRRFEDQGYAYWTYTRPFASVVEANSLMQEDPRQEDANASPVLYHDSLHVTQQSRFTSTVYHVTGTISLLDVASNAQNWRDASESVSVTMAGGVISHSGGVRQGNTVTYTIHYNESATIDVVGQVGGASDIFFTAAPLVVIAGLLIVALALLALGVRLLRR